ncbi:reverse transcriptase [Aphelenchoides avenae]|nr:reverse transcriptase [Aphelenchus avenae]
MKLRVYLTAIRPILLYASETWPLTLTEEEHLRRRERDFLREILGYRLRDCISNDRLYQEVASALGPNSRFKDVAETIRQNRLKLLGHTLKREADRLTQIALYYTGEGGWRRRQGGTRMTWLEAVKKDLDSMNIRGLPQFRGSDAVQAYNKGDWLRVVQIIAYNRKVWRLCS